jgi:hypothetical protein
MVRTVATIEQTVTAAVRGIGPSPGMSVGTTGQRVPTPPA